MPLPSPAPGAPATRGLIYSLVLLYTTYACVRFVLNSFRQCVLFSTLLGQTRTYFSVWQAKAGTQLANTLLKAYNLVFIFLIFHEIFPPVSVFDWMEILMEIQIKFDFQWFWPNCDRRPWYDDNTFINKSTCFSVLHAIISHSILYYQLQKCTHMHSYGDAILSVNTSDLPIFYHL